MVKKSKSQIADEAIYKASQDSIVLEKTLASIGALSAVRIVRRSFPYAPDSVK